MKFAVFKESKHTKCQNLSKFDFKQYDKSYKKYDNNHVNPELNLIRLSMHSNTNNACDSRQNGFLPDLF